MISTELKDCWGGGNGMEVVLHSNKYEFSISIGDHFCESINLNKQQVGELLESLKVMHKEML